MVSKSQKELIKKWRHAQDRLINFDIFIHNLKFDISILHEFLISNSRWAKQWKIPIHQFGSNHFKSSYSFKLPGFTLRLNFKNSYSLISQKLGNLSKNFLSDPRYEGYRALKGSVEFCSLKTLDDIDETLIKYVRNDTTSLIMVMYEFNKKMNKVYRDMLNTKSEYYTLSKNTISAFSRSFYSIFCKDFLIADQYALSSEYTYLKKVFKGGRSEPFCIGHYTAPKGWVILGLDYVSLYPAQAIKMLPYGLPFKGDPSYIGKEGFMSICNIQFRTKTEYLNYPALFMSKDQFGNLRCFHSEEFSDPILVDYPELMYAIKSEMYDIKYIDIYTFKAKEHMSSFIKFLFEGKRKADIAGDDVSKQIFKLLINAAYGFTVTRQENNKKSILVNPKEAVINRYTKLQLMGIAKIFTLKSTSRYEMFELNEKEISNTYLTNFSVGSSITSYGRVALYEMILASFKNENVKTLYCDTDSLYFAINVGEEILEKIKKEEKTEKTHEIIMKYINPIYHDFLEEMHYDFEETKDLGYSNSELDDKKGYHGFASEMCIAGSKLYAIKKLNGDNKVRLKGAKLDGMKYQNEKGHFEEKDISLNQKEINFDGFEVMKDICKGLTQTFSFVSFSCGFNNFTMRKIALEKCKAVPEYKLRGEVLSRAIKPIFDKKNKKFTVKELLSLINGGCVFCKCINGIPQQQTNEISIDLKEKINLLNPKKELTLEILRELVSMP